MPIDQLLRDELHRVTTSPEGGPDLETCIQGGRRLRRNRQVAVGTGGVALAAGAVVAAASIVGGSATPDHKVAVQAADASPFTDFVAGSNVDETMQTAVATALPSSGQADDVYASDWTRDDALPDDQFANATDWEAVYTISGDEKLLVVMGYERNAGQSLCRKSDTVGGPDTPECFRAHAGGGTLQSSGYTLTGSPEHVYVTSFVKDGFVVNALDYVDASSWAQADARRQLDPDQLGDLVLDPTLTFTAPDQWPTSRH